MIGQPFRLAAFAARLAEYRGDSHCYHAPSASGWLSALNCHHAARYWRPLLETKADAPHTASMETFCIAIDDGREPQAYEMELPSVGAAQEELTRIFGDMISNGVADFWAARDWRISVSKAGMPLFVLRASALQLGGPVSASQ